MSQRDLCISSILLGIAGTMTFLSLTWNQPFGFGISAILTILILVGIIIKSMDDNDPPALGGNP